MKLASGKIIYEIYLHHYHCKRMKIFNHRNILDKNIFGIKYALYMHVAYHEYVHGAGFPLGLAMFFHVTVS